MQKSMTRRDLLGVIGAAPFATAAAVLASQSDHEHPSLSSADKEKQAFPFLTLRMFIETRSQDTNGVVAIVRVFVSAGDGPPPHVHSREDEIHTVVRGRYRYRHGDLEMEAPAGTVIFMPRGVPHVFRNVGNEPGEHLVTLIRAVWRTCSAKSRRPRCRCLETLRD